jgi:hypothetical protein
VSRSARTSFNFVWIGGPCDETKNSGQLVGLQEGALVNERPDLPDDLLKRTLGQETTSCACMRKSRSPLWTRPGGRVRLGVAAQESDDGTRGRHGPGLVWPGMSEDEGLRVVAAWDRARAEARRGPSTDWSLTRP